ncbi:hypothetical protein EC991_002305 [Linnemannia zychae]|nr:hypothetical protein EC991_002305 [Linnemannia zychae]
MIHRSAIYYQLARTVDSAHKKIMLSKTEHSAIPSLRFRELVEEEEDTPIKSFKVLRRCPTRPVSACEARGSGCANTSDDLSEAASSAPAQSSPWSSSGGQSNNGRRSGVTLEQREVEYAKARARIFDSGDDVEGANDGGDDQEHEDMYRRTSDFVVSSGELAVGKKEESRRSVSGVSTAKSSSSVDSHSRLDVGQGNGQKQSKPKSDLTRRTSTSSTVSSSSTSSGTTMGDTSARSDFVGSWIAGHHHPHHHHQGSSSGVQPSSGTMDYQDRMSPGGYADAIFSLTRHIIILL